NTSAMMPTIVALVSRLLISSEVFICTTPSAPSSKATTGTRNAISARMAAYSPRRLISDELLFIVEILTIRPHWRKQTIMPHRLSLPESELLRGHPSWVKGEHPRIRKMPPLRRHAPFSAKQAVTRINGAIVEGNQVTRKQQFSARF